ncbi:hypothetical protein KAH55_06240 [bacterium]|nr:hypothetical protein [bacterium]
MNTTTKRILFWTPRILGILFAAFISLFALDVFSEGLGFWRTLLALLIHLIPVYVIVLVLALAWRWEWIGAVFFLLIALFHIIWGWGRFHWGAFLGIDGPLVLLSLLFLINWIFRRQIRDKPVNHK